MGAWQGDEPADTSSLIIEGDRLPPKEELHLLVRAARPRQVAAAELPPLDSLTVSQQLVIRAIRVYQQRISAKLNRRCLLEPSCSRYAEFAVAYQGVFGGAISTWKRLRRCKPANEGSIDYPKGVPVAVPDSQHRSRLQRQDSSSTH